MRSMKGEVVLNIPAQRAWEIYRNDEIISQINPEMLTCAQYIEGDGSPGSIRRFKLGPAVHEYVKESTQKIEKVEAGESVTYSVIGGELCKLYDPYRVTFSFYPMQGHEEEKMCVAEWKAEFRPLTPTTPPPEQAGEAALGFLKCFDKFQVTC